MVAQWPQRWSAMANSPLVSSHRPSCSATLITSSFRRVEHGRRLAGVRPLIRSPWAVNAGGAGRRCARLCRSTHVPQLVRISSLEPLSAALAYREAATIDQAPLVDDL